MYQFKIIKAQEGGYKFELDGIKLIVDDYNIIRGKHILKTPGKAIAFFNIGDDVYGISNEPHNLKSAEELFDAIKLQYKIFTSSETHPGYNAQKYAGNNNIPLKRSA